MPKQKQSTSPVPWRAVCITAIISFSIATIGIFVVEAAGTFKTQSLTALNLASEGLDALRSTRNVNWIRFREDPKKCWLNLPQENVCSTENTIKSGYYALHKTTDISQWELVYTGSTPEAAPDLNTGKNTNNSYPVEPAHTAIVLDTTGFYRMIQVEYESDEEVTVTSVVMWKTFFGVQTTRLVTSITNYLNVENG